MKVKVKILSEEAEEHNMKGSMNMGYKLKISYEGRSMTVNYHDSVNNYQNGVSLDTKQVLDGLSDNFIYHDYTVEQIKDEFGDEMTESTCKAIIKEASDMKRVFQNEETIQKLKAFANGEEFESSGSKESFNDDKTKLFDGMDETTQNGLKQIIKNETIGDDFDIELISKKVKTTSGKDMFLLGITKNNERVYLERGSWDCEWYWGFGYIETFDPQWSSHTHFSGFNEGKNQDLRTAFLEYFKGGKLTITAKESWTLCELMNSFETLKETAGLYHRGGSHLTTNPVLKEDKKIEKRANDDILKVIIEVQKMLSPKGADYESTEGNY